MDTARAQKLSKLKIEGFKSIGQAQTIEFGDINVLIGANGAGKSNLVSFFRLIEALVNGRLQSFIGKQGFADGILHYGTKNTERFGAKLLFEDAHNSRDQYEFALVHSYEGQMMFAFENHDGFAFKATSHEKVKPHVFGEGHKESKLMGGLDDFGSQKILRLLNGIAVFQFNDTSSESAIRQPCMLSDNRQLHSDGANLASFLYQMKLREDRNKYYQRIVRRIAEIMPQFRDFELKPLEINPNMIRLDWKDKNKEHIFGAHQISDGSLRFMALATLLLQPIESLPRVIVIDEPELGLHPDALKDLIGMIAIASEYSQIILSTQSSFLMNLFEPEDIIVVSAEKGSTEFKRLNSEELKVWFEDYSLAELWEKNLIGGRK